MGADDGAGQVDLRRGGRCLADPDGVAVGLDVVVGAAGLDALRMVLGVPALDRDVGPRLGMSSHCSPWSSSKARAAGSSPLRLRPLVRTIVNRPFELLAVELELELAVRDRGRGVGRRRLRLPGAPVPDDDVAGAVLLGGMTPSKSKYSIGWSSTWTAIRRTSGSRVEALRDGPRDEDAPDLEAEVVVEPGRAVALDDEAASRGPGPALGGRAPPAAGSGVFAKSRLRRYSSRGIGRYWHPMTADVPYPQDLLDLTGRVTIVTGASQGIGAGIATRFATAGARVVVHYRRDRQAAKHVVAGIVSAGGTAVAIAAELDTEAGVTRFFAEADDRLGPSTS